VNKFRFFYPLFSVLYKELEVPTYLFWGVFYRVVYRDFSS